ncbi:hypothetical protein PENTCL1PPCAC_3593, partial [Pristionchus entomophagus]
AEPAGNISTAARFKNVILASSLVDALPPLSAHSSQSATRSYNRPTSVNEREAKKTQDQREKEHTKAERKAIAKERMNARAQELRTVGYDTEQLINSVVVNEELSLRRDNELKAFARLLTEADEAEKKQLIDEFCRIHTQGRKPAKMLHRILTRHGLIDQE